MMLNLIVGCLNFTIAAFCFMDDNPILGGINLGLGIANLLLFILS